MKKNLLFLLFAATVLTLPMFAKTTDPTNANYYIRGEYSVTKENGKVKYTLSNVSSKGISFKPEGVWEGTYMEESGDIEFVFHQAKTMYPGGFRGNELTFWAYDKDIDEWQKDVEVRQGTSSFQTTKEMTVMLVLDCSSSLGSDFIRVQQSAKSFIRKMYEASGSGNVKIGIIGFNTLKNTDRNVYEIAPLNTINYTKMIEFIDGLTAANGTALYYSIDKAAKMMETYANNLDAKHFDSAFMLVFTDGIDNTSTDYSNNIMTSDEYFKKAQSILDNTTILNKPITNCVVGCKGQDIETASQQKKFDKLLGDLSNDYRSIQQFSELEGIFNEIAERLITNWQSLKCYIPSARIGQVCWTLGNIAEPAPKIVRSGSKHFIGANVGGNFLIAAEGVLGGFNFGADYAYMLTPKFGLGGYMSFEPVFGEENGFEFTFGLQFVGGNLEEKRAVFIGGVGACVGYPVYALDMRSGVLFRSGVYLTLNAAFGASDYYNPRTGYYETGFGMDLGLHIGYNFGRLLR